MVAYHYMSRVRVATTGWPGAPGLNTFYFASSGDADVPDSDDATEVAVRVRSALNSDFKQNFPTTWIATVSPTVDVLSAVTGALIASYSVAPGATVAGTTSATFGPEASMLALNQLTDAVVNGKRVRGRSYFGPIAPVADANGTPTATQKNNIELFGTTAANMGGGEWAWVCWHRPVDAANGSAHPITSWILRDRFAVLRSRRS
jgi:hypothetical protein